MIGSCSKEDIKAIAEKLVEMLRECNDGTRTTTCLLLKAAGLDVMQIDQLDLMCIHNELTKEARTNHIKLDDSEHAGKCEGLPYNLDFIVHNRRAQVKCPN